MGIIETAWDKTNRRQDEQLLIAALSDFSLRSVIRPHLYELDPADFFNPTYGRIWSVARELADENRIITLAPFKARLSDDEYHALVAFQDTGARLVEVERGIEYVRDAAKRRRFLEALKQAATQAGQSEHYDDVLGTTHTLLAELDQTEVTAHAATTRELYDIFWDEVENPPEKPRTIATPWPDFNSRLSGGGFGRGRLGVVAAGTGGGKSLVMLNTALQAALDGYKVAIFSLEMSQKEVFDRMVAALSGQGINPIESRRLEADRFHPEYGRSADTLSVQEATERLRRSDCQIWDDGKMSADWIRSQCVAMHRTTGLDLVIVDYLQIMESDLDSREQAVSENARMLKVLAKSLNVAVLTGSQMNEKELGSERPTTVSLRESRGIGNHADVIFFVVHEDDSGAATLSLAKQRNGGLGTAPVWFDGYRARFLSNDKTFIGD